MSFLRIRPNYELALLIVRVVVGSIFVLHGAQKVFGLFGGPGLAGFATWLAPMGVPTWLAYSAALSELVAGTMVLLGIAAELGACMIIVQMAVAIYLVHWPHGYFIQDNGFEYALNSMALCVAIIVGGARRYSLWSPFDR